MVHRKLKRRRLEKQTPNNIANALLSTPTPSMMLHSPAIFILHDASLRTAFVKKNSKILDSDEDAHFLLKQKKNLNDYRPDIVHEAIRCILDSPLNKAGMVGAIYVKIDQGPLFEVKPHVRIP